MVNKVTFVGFGGLL